MLKKITVLLSACLLSACVQQDRPVFWRGESPAPEETTVAPPTVAIVLPLSGESGSVGNSLKDAALMAAFEHPKTPAKVLFFDTESTPAGAEQAYRWALAQRPDIVLGPVFSKEVAAIKNAGVSVPLLTFSSDTTLMTPQVATMAVTVPEQIRQMVRHACSSNQKRLAVLGPDSKTGEIAMNALAEEIQTCPGMNLKKVSFYDAKTMNFTNAVKKILPASVDSSDKDKSAPQLSMSQRAGIDAIILFEEGIKLRQLLSILAFYDAGARDIPVYGLTVVKQINDNNASYVYYADLDETNYRNFSREYQNQFGRAPIRIASQMYDAMGWILSEAAAGRPVRLADLQTRPSYWGVDGLVRLNEDGTNRRSLQLRQKRAKSAILIEPAESSFDDRASVGWNTFRMPTTESVDLASEFPEE